MSNYKNFAETYFTAAGKLKKECLDHIKEILNNCDGQRLSWDDEILDEYGLDPIMIGYDGGNHPEYASNMFSEVECVRVNDNGFIVIETEDGEMYAENITNVVEIYEICDFLDLFINSTKE